MTHHDAEDVEERMGMMGTTNTRNDDLEDDDNVEDTMDVMDIAFSEESGRFGQPTFDYACENDDEEEKDANDTGELAAVSPEGKTEEEEVFKTMELEAEVHAKQNYGWTPTVHHHFFHQLFGNATTGKYCMEREECSMDGSQVCYKLKHTPPGQILGGQTYMDGLHTVTQHQTQPKLWDSLLSLPVLVAETL
jgi:hypothetical protein